MIHKIGIVSKNLSFFNLINQQKRADTEIEIEFLRDIDSLKKLRNSGKFISSFVFDSTHTNESIIEFGKYIRGSGQKNALIFLALEDFETFQVVTADENFTDAKIINMPSPAADIYHRLVNDTRQAESQTNQKSKTEGTISNASFLNIFIESTMSTIKEMAQCEEISHAAPFLLDYEKMENAITIRGKLAIKSPYFTGSFFISFPEETYLKVCSRVLYEEVTAITKENEDLVSEFCNIVYGKSKVAIAKLNMKLDMVIPTYNRDSSIQSTSSVLVVKFITELGPFYIKVAPGLV